jgi:signal transduction histidine kinase
MNSAARQAHGPRRYWLMALVALALGLPVALLWYAGIGPARLRDAALLVLATLLGVALLAALGLLLGRDLRRRDAEAAALDARNRELDQMVQERTRNLSALSSHLQHVREEEKAALARELHDELGGLLVAAKMDLMWLRRQLDNGDPMLAERWNRVQRLLEQGVDLKRGIIESLRPTLLDNLGLVAALRWLVGETARRSGLRCRERYDEAGLGELGPEMNIALYRIAQECLTNIMKHAQATEATVELACTADRIVLNVADNGRGIARPGSGAPQSYGIAGMQQRVVSLGGEMSIAASADARGTVVRVSIPRGRAQAFGAAAPFPAGSEAGS